METQKNLSINNISVDIIRVVAIVVVLFLHAVCYGVGDALIFNELFILRGWIVNIYLCIGRMGVPLFIMLTGALLLAPSKKDEDLSVFFKKRFSRIGLPVIFWATIYFLWDKLPITQLYVINGVLSIPYITFWYIYTLVGLYLIAPLIRVMVAHFTSKHFKYFTVLWLVGTLLPVWVDFLSGGMFSVYGNLFLIPLSLGYFIMGSYLVRLQIRRKILVALFISSIALTAIGTFFITSLEGGSVFFFQEYYSPTIIMASVSLFMLLNSFSKPNTSQTEKPTWKYRIMHSISQNSFSIYMFHIIILALLRFGFFGFELNGYTLDAIVSVPLLVVLTLLFSLIVIVPLKKVPGLRRLLG
ncbi:MAG: acyltransferase family protein [Nitrososphaerota archaeon]|jgi:surface polysaccharide O-acyltransferase-like enzyme|nr:acyltransferase family protein [Nitrososphaerota archaeon]